MDHNPKFTFFFAIIVQRGVATGFRYSTSGLFQQLSPPPLTIKSPPSPADPKDRLFLKIVEKNEKFLGPKGRDFF